MLDAARKCWMLLPRKLRLGLVGLFLLMHLQALAQLTMVASIMPFLQALADPHGAAEGRTLQLLRRYLGPMDETELLLLLGAIVIAAVIAANSLGAAHSILSARYAARTNTYLSTRLLRSYLSRPYSFFLSRNSSEFFRNIFSEVERVSDGFLQTGMDAIGRLLVIIALTVLLVAINPWIALGAGLFFAGSYTLIYHLLRPRLVHASEMRAECESLRYKAISEAFGTIKELKVLGREANFVRAFAQPSRRLFRYQERAQLYSELPRNLIETVAFAGIVGIALLLLHQHEGITDALPVLGLFAVAGYRLLPAIKGFYSCCSHLRYHHTSVERVYHECITVATEAPQAGIAQESDRKSRLPLRSSIQLNHVTFGYPGSTRAALHDITLTLPARCQIGLCGKSGSGKTTMADIILGLLHPQNGAMSVDEVVIDSSNVAKWQQNCGYVPQQIYLTDDTIRRNIAFGIPPEAINDDQVRSAAQIANLDGFIQSELPDGYETEVGEGGIRLSGGQRQRIGIARALYHDPDVVVLDEATSSLDAETEQAIVEAVQSLAGRKTVLIIAHRLSTIRRADLLVFIENGSIAATGTFDQLCEENSRFRHLVALS